MKGNSFLTRPFGRLVAISEVWAQLGSKRRSGMFKTNDSLVGFDKAVVDSIRVMGARPSEARVAFLLMKGLGNKLIARELNIAESTVKVHVSSLLRITKVTNRVQLTNKLFEHIYSQKRDLK
jgi:DNA-binding NarL/FixJ family response regulator